VTKSSPGFTTAIEKAFKAEREEEVCTVGWDKESIGEK
jgi:hypothetical protein